MVSSPGGLFDRLRRLLSEKSKQEVRLNESQRSMKSSLKCSSKKQAVSERSVQPPSSPSPSRSCASTSASTSARQGKSKKKKNKQRHMSDMDIDLDIDDLGHAEASEVKPGNRSSAICPADAESSRPSGRCSIGSIGSIGDDVPPFEMGPEDNVPPFEVGPEENLPPFEEGPEENLPPFEEGPEERV